MSRQNLAERLEALATMSPADLHHQWTSVSDEPPPQVALSLLSRLLAQRIQEKCHGRLPAEIERKLLAIANGQKVAQAPPTVAVSDGTRFIREWQGRTVEVLAIGDGFEWNGQRYGSLSKIAREVTGTHQSGPRFFGLKGSAHG